MAGNKSNTNSKKRYAQISLKVNSVLLRKDKFWSTL